MIINKVGFIFIYGFFLVVILRKEINNNFCFYVIWLVLKIE